MTVAPHPFPTTLDQEIHSYLLRFISELILAPLLLPLFQAIDAEWIGTEVLWPNLYHFIDCFYRQKGEMCSQERCWCSQPVPQERQAAHLNTC